MQKIGRYEIIEELGRGSMGAVFKARDPQIGRIVAIKIILTANLPKEENDLYRARFYREAQAAGKMSHPGIVTIHDIAEDESGQPFLVMEYVEGSTLYQLLRPSPGGKIQRFPLSRTLDLCAQVSDALDYAHCRGVVHRDIKPGNVMVNPEGRAKIADFGIARLSGTEATHTASITGTPAYMSPEQFRGGMIDKRSDIFSLGAMLYWMATGQKPFPGDNVTQVSFNVVYREPAPPRQIVPELPQDLEIVLSRCLAKRPDHRYPNAAEVAADLRAMGEGKGIATTLAPPEATVEDTVVTMANITPVGAPATDEKKKASEEKSPAAAALVTVVAVAFLAVGAWLWSRSGGSAAPSPAPVAENSTKPAESAGPSVASSVTSKEQDGTGGAAATAAPARPPVSNGVPAAKQTPTAAGKSAGATAPSQPKPAVEAPVSRTGKKPDAAANASLVLDCRHGFKEATMEIEIEGGKNIYRGKMQGKAGAFGTKGVLAEKIPISAGKHAVKVRIHSPADKYVAEKQIEGDFAAAQALTLEVRFGLRNRNLSLKWKK